MNHNIKKITIGTDDARMIVRFIYGEFENSEFRNAIKDAICKHLTIKANEAENTTDDCDEVITIRRKK